MKKNYWLRGAIFGFVVFILAVGLFSSLNYPHDVMGAFYDGFFSFRGFWELNYFALLAFIFIGGSLGRIYGKIKNRNQV